MKPIKTYYQMPKQAKTFFWILACLLNIAVIFSACHTSAKSVGGYTLAVTIFVILLLTYSHEVRIRHLLAWPLVAYSFYGILIHGYLGWMRVFDRAAYKEMGSGYPLYLFWFSNTPYVFAGISLVTAGLFGLLAWKKKIDVFRLMKISFAANIVVLVLSSVTA